jgi:hypothetical protein
MTVAVYKLRIRERPDDDSAWHEARVVAASLPEALVQAQQRFGEELILAIEQDATAAAHDADAEDDVDGGVVADAEPANEQFAAPVAMASPGLTYERAPMPWEGRWRPSVLLWTGAGIGLLLMVLWINFGEPARNRFVTAKPGVAAEKGGLALDETAPAGGVLAAAGLDLRRGSSDGALASMVDQTVGAWAGDDEGDPVLDGDAPVDQATVRNIGTIVGDMFARWPHDAEPESPPNQPAQPYPEEPSAVAPDDGRLAALPPPTLAAPEPSALRPFYVEVLRSGNITETLRVTAYDADHARALVADQPGHPAIVRGPSPQLDW